MIGLLLILILVISSIVSGEYKVKVSIVLPIYNSVDYLERRIKCILNQTLKEIELLVINDGSSDATTKLLKKYEEDDRVRIGIARNKEIDLANGEFIGFMDDDDYMDNQFFERLYRYSGEKDVVVGTFVDCISSSKYCSYIKNLAVISSQTCSPFEWSSIHERHNISDHGFIYSELSGFDSNTSGLLMLLFWSSISFKDSLLRTCSKSSIIYTFNINLFELNVGQPLSLNIQCKKYLSYGESKPYGLCLGILDWQHIEQEHIKSLISFRRLGHQKLRVINSTVLETPK
ncbi:glycosyltransferase family 2 protein [Piromyces sp. E2]|nr:glycosyltransferase family 2 protein [Piromyces sp. E2]|eukprot:OUM70370.1 glycosyltransferase family 2 protein [Piromyces sp. E2]